MKNCILFVLIFVLGLVSPGYATDAIVSGEAYGAQDGHCTAAFAAGHSVEMFNIDPDHEDLFFRVVGDINDYTRNRTIGPGCGTTGALNQTQSLACFSEGRGRCDMRYPMEYGALSEGGIVTIGGSAYHYDAQTPDLLICHIWLP